MNNIEKKKMKGNHVTNKATSTLTYWKYDQLISPFVPEVGATWQKKKPVKFNAYAATFRKRASTSIALLEEI